MGTGQECLPLTGAARYNVSYWAIKLKPLPMNFTLTWGSAARRETLWVMSLGWR